MKYANVIIDIAHEKVDRPFQYRIPEEFRSLAEVGQEVSVPFGKGNTVRKAYIIELTNQAEWEEDKIKDILALNEKAVSAQTKMIKLAYWMKKRYGSTTITALKTVLPVKKKVKEQQHKDVECLVSDEELQRLIEKCNPYRQSARKHLLEEFLMVKTMPYPLVTGKLNVAPSTIASLQKQGVLSISVSRAYRNPVLRSDVTAKKNILSKEQQYVVDEITKDMQSKTSHVSLLHGITGSGKTEVYMELIERNIAMGKQAIVLIPEIALTFQTLMRFYARFGDRVSVMHSRLSDGERFDQYERALKGELDIMIGPRSALFTPFANLGLIVIDEEHESSYKSEKMPKYHAKEVAEYIAKQENAILLLGSATPSLDSYFKAKNGEYRLFELKNRHHNAMLPCVHVADMRKELKEGNKSFFSQKLKELLLERMVRGEQAMLFINRRGYAGFVSCRECGHVLKCPHCDVSLSQHYSKYRREPNGGEHLVCHYCGYEIPMVNKCPKCGSKYIAGFRAGTERIEEELKKWYPSIRVLRMDADTTKKKEDYENILSAFAAKEADVLIGTQMIVKGHDFPNVTLVGAIAADLSLHAGDYRAAERTFQLLTQAAGRAGRGDKAGEVVIQTYQPDNYSIISASKQDYKRFYAEEILYRQLADYPPVHHMLAIQIYSMNENAGLKLAQQIADELRNRMTKEGLQDIAGPVAAAVAKINDIYRHIVYVKHENNDVLVEAKDLVEEWLKQQELNAQNVQFDFDPINLM